MREQSDQYLAAITQDVVRPVYLFHAEWEGGDARYWTGIGSLIWEGQEFTGMGKLVGVSEIEEIADIEAGGVTIALAGISDEDLARVLNSARQNKKGTVYLGLMDAGPVVPIFNRSEPGLASDDTGEWPGLVGASRSQDGDYAVITANATIGDHGVYALADPAGMVDILYFATRLRRGTTRYAVVGMFEIGSTRSRVATVDFDAATDAAIISHSIDEGDWLRARRLPDGDVLLEQLWRAEWNGTVHVAAGPSPDAVNTGLWNAEAAGTESVKILRSMLYQNVSVTGHGLVRDPVIVFRGRLDFTQTREVPQTDEQPRLNVIEVRYENELVRLSVPTGGRYTHESQQVYYPGDMFFQYIEAIQNRTDKWGGG